ncbi:hypothetical protein B0I72DRAFT_161652 [Yarrowia lipolytica]|uniref:YALI0D16159p n=2 Tax=Yarrowia lipolytica TaxID=4952 RepID=Q6C8X4_YARLI|nr:YALI0D16159p [Yarrowia lipolytica CLIB122]AOW04133.1 hypothetical protein YALI1_D19971g [Yarrowia lipolytica]KAE8170654.1 hypothetical protein BKA90DRAFT_86932 [Yarrowia lipolytica]RDW22631.1 hypothetical protein B0I71DRAFT_149773 [Yarrowia lipolytica]RDW29356.1 hypothetical protein B0I72DRAFT_161652 [Yarrowia lipolytica]RDW36140.1 hypothetical protein B0I73DRAFT_162294 [Yarrowia lipolytica]|eukprot:XP_502888.1 YALI0D16159p [Yarrowia lipolytica CLIB122]
MIGLDALSVGVFAAALSFYVYPLPSFTKTHGPSLSIRRTSGFLAGISTVALSTSSLTCYNEASTLPVDGKIVDSVLDSCLGSLLSY